MLKLKIVQAKHGDCLILTYGSTSEPKYMLIDGGPPTVYKNHLKSELEAISKSGGQIDHMVLSHVDADHIVGLIKLTTELRKQAVQKQEPLIAIKDLWFNSFQNSIGKGNQVMGLMNQVFSPMSGSLQSTMPHGNLAFHSIKQGSTLRINALDLDIPINNVVGEELISVETAPEPIKLDNMKVHIVGPTEENLSNLRTEWVEWLDENRDKLAFGEEKELKMSDRSVPNLSSIMFLIEAEGTTLLFTGDGRGDHLLEGLAKANLLNAEGKIHVNVFKVPHHGSIRNADAQFFEIITADKYIISADGRHHNPDLETLKYIVEKAHQREAPIELIFTNKTDATEKLMQEFPPKQHNYTTLFLEPEKNALELEFSQSVS